MIPAVGENYLLKVFKRKENSPYEYNKECAFAFRGRPSSSLEKKRYRIAKGVDGGESSVSIYATNVSGTLEDGDHVEYLGRMWTVVSVGYYIDKARMVNGGIFSPDRIGKRSPKGVQLA